MIRVQTDDFDVGSEYQALCEQTDADGAVVFFVGKVRNQNLDRQVDALYLEHYPGMTEASLKQLVEQASSRWQIGNCRVIHRIGHITVGEQIVFVGVTSMHRQAAFEAGQFLMDKLKTEAPFWKKELTQDGEHWVEARQSDTDQVKKWE